MILLKKNNLKWSRSHRGSNSTPDANTANALTTAPPKLMRCEGQNNYLSYPYGKENFGTWGARPCTVPGVTELQILRPYVLSKGSGSYPS